MTTPPSRASAILGGLLLAAAAAIASAQETKTEYVHGDPSAEIQYLVELINRARLDPVGEGDRIFADYGSPAIGLITSTFEANDSRHWTRAENRALWQGYAPRPALAYNQSLGAASHQWSVIMRSRDTVAQGFSDAPGLLSRATQQGYAAFWLAQLVQGYSTDMLFCHASWAIDWSVTLDPVTGRTTLFNRELIINPANKAFLQMHEIGVGVVNRPNPPPGGVGPQVVTVAFGASNDAFRRFATGVCYEDKNQNGFYDPGEGFRGVRIDVNKSNFFAITSTSGGYAVPIPHDAGPVQITATGVPGKASQILPTQTVHGNTLVFGTAANVKADFVLPPRAAPPAFASFGGGVGSIPASTAGVFDVEVDGFDPARTTIGDVDVDVVVRHGDRSRLRLALEAPDGTLATLWEGGPGGADVVGSFDRTLRPRDGFARFVDRPYAGTWRLHVEDAAGLPVDVEGWTLHVRPRFEGPLHARSPHLVVRTLRLKQKAKAQGDRLTLKADIDVGTLLSESDAERLTLLIRDPEPPYAEVMRVPFAGPVGATSVALDGQTNVTFVPSRKGTSRARLVLDLRGVDLPILPKTMRLEIALGDHLVSEDVRVSKGRFNGKRNAPEGGTIRIDRVRSRSHPLGRRTDVRGRFLQPRLAGFPGIIEARVGETSGLWRSGPKAVLGSRLVYGAAGTIQRLSLDPSTGKFVIRVIGEHEAIDAAGDLDVSLWIGRYFEATTVRPAVETDGTFRY